MSENDAAEFLKKLDADDTIRAKVAEGYRRLLIETGREAGLAFTDDELRVAALAFRQRSYQEIPDAELAMVTGGQHNSTWGGPGIDFIINSTI